MISPGVPRCAAALLLCAGVVLAGCGGGEEAPLTSPPGTAFEPAAYDYLTPIRLNVASVSIQQEFKPQTGDLGALAPIPPLTALRQMAQDRLGAFGAQGRAVFVILDASLRRDGDDYIGSFAVALSLLNGEARIGYAEAAVTRRRTISPITPRDAALYALTKDLMDQMNVEFEYQVRHSLRDFLVAAPSAEPAVEHQPLAPPSGAETPASGTTPAPETVPPAAPQSGPVSPSGLPPAVRPLGTLPAT